MASTGNNGELEFSEKVKKTFGNLFASISPSPSPSSLSNPLWSLTGTQVEKREWRRDQDTSDRDNNPCASSFDDFLSCARKNSRKNLKDYKKEFNDDEDMQHLDVDDDDDEGGDGDGGKIGDIDDWDLRGSIGLDSTLDNEDEEDAYDKLAIGREDADDRLYMGAVADKSIPKPISQDGLSPNSGGRQRDPRANRLAAKIRLKEDDAEVAAEAGQCKTARASSASTEKPVSSPGDGNIVKPILRRKEHESTSKPAKRVRFDPEFVKESSASLTGKESKGSQISSDDTTPISSDDTTPVTQSSLDGSVRQVPDYLQNPSKYTCYSFDSTDEMNDKSNTESDLDVLDMVKMIQNSGSLSEQKDALTDLPKSITFVPKKKPDSAKVEAVNSDLGHSSTQSTLVASLVDEDIRETEVGDMEVGEPETSAEAGISSRKQGRQYRTKSHADAPE